MANLWSLQKMFRALTVPDPSLGSETGGIGMNKPHNLSPGPSSSSSGLQQPPKAADHASFPVLPPPHFVPLTPQDPRPLSGLSPTPDPRASHNPFCVPFPPQFVPLPSPFPQPSPSKGKSWDLLVDALPPKAHHPAPPPSQLSLQGRRPLPELPSAPMTTKGKNRDFGAVEDPLSSTKIVLDKDDSIDVQDPPEYVDPFGEFESDSHLSDIEYAIALQIEEIETLNETLEDEEIARRLQAELDGVDMFPPNVAPPRYNLRPRRSRAASNASAGPSTAAKQSVSRIKSACTSCYDTLEHLEGLRSSCGHTYCFACVRSMVNAGLEGGSTPFPPRCCQILLVPDGENAPPKPSSSKNKDRDNGKEEGCRQIQLLGVVLDDPELIAKMETKWQELSMDPGDRVYCCNPGCSLFLGSASSPPPSLSASSSASSSSPSSSSSSSSPSSPPSYSSRTPHSSSTSPPFSFFRRFSGSKTNTTTNVIPHRLQCPTCSTLTCVACKQAAHVGQSCTEKVDNQFWDLVNVKSWKRCPYCKSVVEKNGGCSQVQCRCGRAFTYA